MCNQLCWLRVCPISQVEVWFGYYALITGNLQILCWPGGESASVWPSVSGTKTDPCRRRLNGLTFI